MADQELGAALFEMVYYSGQCGMTLFRQQASFQRELSNEMRITEVRLFDGDHGFQPLVHRFVDRRHATLAKMPNDAITPLEQSIR